MIKEIKKNGLRWIMPYDLEKEYATNEIALDLVNGKNRTLVINGYVLISTNKKDLEYIHDLFSSVRIKTGYVNTIKFYGIEYATNYQNIMFNGKNEKLKEQFHKRFIKIEDLILNYKTIEDLREAKNFIISYNQKINERFNNKRCIDNLVAIKKTAKK